MAHVCGVLQGKGGRALFFNFLMNISPVWDCYGHAEAPIVSDIYMVASTDPAAIDQASLDLVNRETGIENTELQSKVTRGADKFRELYPDVGWELQLDDADHVDWE